MTEATTPISAAAVAPSEKPKLHPARAWWDTLQPREVNGSRQPGDRATLARLRRASIFEAAADPATLNLYARLRGTAEQAHWLLPRVAVLAIVLASVKPSTARNGSLARRIGVPSGGKPEDAILKPLRLKRLMTARGDEEILIGFRRAVAMADGKVDAADLADLILRWDRDGSGEHTRTRFAFDYYDAADHAPSADDVVDDDAV